jgi:hypothetical protein
MCYGGGFESDHDALPSLAEVGARADDDPDNPFPYYDIPGGMENSSGYHNTAFHAARNDPNGYPARHCEPSWIDQTNWAVKWANEAIEDKALRDSINQEVAMMSSVTAPSTAGFTKSDIKSTTA